ncbi:unnamed protein product [Rotaria sordida]|uniref:CEP63/Deup1 N-terminal domain-containing protein n=1 Tax=Rotaria sordida TaxID=392033 RepID=A0A814H9W7_9BILA|nr:unnamed protein product [Rotaria sordida]
MSDNELDELLSQLKDTCKKNRHHSSNETNLNNILKKIDVFINRRQMKLLNHHKRFDDLQRDLLLSECESSRNRAALEKKDFEVNQLHMMLNKAEQTTQNIMTKYDNEVQKLTEQLSNVQQEYERLKIMHKTNQDNRTMNEVLTEIVRLQELNKMLEIDNQRLYNENDHLKQTNYQTHNHEEIILREKNAQLEKLINSLQRSNQQPLCNQGIDSTIFESKIKTLENDIDFYKRHSDQQEIEIRRLVNELNTEREQHKNELDTYRKNIISDEIDKLRLSLNNSEQQCNLLRLELQRLQTEKEILKVRLIEAKIIDSPISEIKELDNIDYEKLIRNELDINIDQANKLINYSSYHKKILEEKIQQLTNEINQLKKENKTNNVNDLSIQIYQYNENILHSKREMNKLQMEITDKNTIIYNLYKKIECLEQALMISKQRMNAQLNEIEELRSRNQVIASSMKKEIRHIPIFIDGLSTDDESQMRQSIDLNENLCTSSPMKSADIHKYFCHFDSDISSSMGIRYQNHEQLPCNHRNSLSH